MKFTRAFARIFTRLFLLAVFPILLFGCDTFQLTPPSMEITTNWVQAGKTPEELRKDQAECRRDIALVRPPSFSSGGPPDEGWGMSELRHFENCMRAKGWKKE